MMEDSLSKRPCRDGFSFPSPENGNRSLFRDVVISSYLEFWTLDKVQKPGDSEPSRLISISLLLSCMVPLGVGILEASRAVVVISHLIGRAAI
jgi:hypothetical protein